jgi:hypothetical protein
MIPLSPAAEQFRRSVVYGAPSTELHTVTVMDVERLRGPFAKSFTLAKREAEKLGILGQNRINSKN